VVHTHECIPQHWWVSILYFPFLLFFNLPNPSFSFTPLHLNFIVISFFSTSPLFYSPLPLLCMLLFVAIVVHVKILCWFCYINMLKSVCVSVCCISCITKIICACLFVHHYLFQHHHLKSFVFWFVCVASFYYIDVLPNKQCNWLFWLLMMVDWTLVATITHMHWWWWASDENILIKPSFQHFKFCLDLDLLHNIVSSA